jgi:Reverse transcriptase (RNA-dependent DNA polymerase)
VSATWLGPPRRTRSENCNGRSTGRPRPIRATVPRALRQGLPRGVLERAWGLVRANRGAAGIDRQTIAAVEEYGVSRLLDELAADLKEGRWRPLPARRVFIPKPGRPMEQRPLSTPAVRDRVVQAATRTVIEPIFEADMLECSFGFRPRRSAHDALQVLVDEAWRGRRWVAESDIASCFQAIPHSGFDGGSREADLRPPRAEAAARDAARGSHDGRGGHAQRHRYAAGRGALTLPGQRLPAPARPAMGRPRHGRARPLRGRSAGHVPHPAGSRTGAARAHGDPGRARP